MKGLIIAIIIGLVFTNVVEAEDIFDKVSKEQKQERWKLYGKDKYSSMYYDSESLLHLNKSDVRVWVKVVYLKPVIFIPTYAKDPSDETFLKQTSKLLALLKINCSERKIAYLNSYRYLKNGKKENIDVSQESYYIRPEEETEKLYNIVCNKK